MRVCWHKICNKEKTFSGSLGYLVFISSNNKGNKGMTTNNTVTNNNTVSPVNSVVFPFNVEVWYEYPGVFVGESVWGTNEVWFSPEKGEEQEFLIVCERLGLQPEKKGENKWGENSGEVNYAINKTFLQGREVYQVWCTCGTCDPESRWFIW